jgi:hypothetical protein
MALSLPPPHLAVTNVVRTFLAEQEWDDDVSLDGFTSQVSTTFRLMSNPLSCISKWMSARLFMFPPSRLLFSQPKTWAANCANNGEQLALFPRLQQSSGHLTRLDSFPEGP